MLQLVNGMKDMRLDHYRSHEGSHYHQAKYKKWNKMLAHHVECAILRRLLSRVGRSREILDAPCGTGRFFETLTEYTDAVYLGDISDYMLDIAREASQDRAAGYIPIDLRTAPAPDSETYEGMLSLRLTHHIYDADVLDEYLHNLSQLARRWLIITFRDAQAPKTRWRCWSRRLKKGKGPLPAQRLDALAKTMGGHGFHLVSAEHVSRWFSGHRYALFVRDPE